MKKPEKMTSDELLEELDDFYMKEDIVAMGVKDLLRTQACKSELIKREEEHGDGQITES